MFRQRMRYQKALLVHAGYQKKILTYKPTTKSLRSIRSLSERVQLATDILISYTDLGARISFIFCSSFSLFSLCITIYALYAYFFKENVISGWASMIVFVSVAFSALFFMIGLVGAYLRRILIEVQGAPPYRNRTDHLYVRENAINRPFWMSTIMVMRQ